MWRANGFVTVRRDGLFLGDRPAEEIAQKRGAPVFSYGLLGRDRVAANFGSLRGIFSSRLHLPASISCALKANPQALQLRFLDALTGIFAVSRSCFLLSSRHRAGPAPRREKRSENLPVRGAPE